MRIFTPTALLLSFSFLASAQTVVPDVRFTAEEPWSGTEIRENAWKNADVLSGFIIPGKFSVETSKTESALLFDDQNLYLRMKGSFVPAFQAADKKENELFSDNHFELFLMTDPNKGEYIHYAVSRGRASYLSVNKDGRTEKLDPKLVRTVVKKDWNQWQALITIPFSALNMKAPAEGTKLKFNLCRGNIDLPSGKTENSCFAVLEFDNFHDPRTWSELQFTRAAGTPKNVYPRSENFRLNLIPNGDFNIGEGDQVPGWIVSKNGVARKETAEFSGQWVMRCTGKAYQALTVYTPSLQEGQMYTLRIKARQIGTSNAIGAMQIRNRPDGKGVTEGASPVWRMPVTDDFREYVIPFKADKDIRGISFYRFGPDQADSGIEYDSIQLYEGKISSFEIRKLARLDRKATVPGTDTTPAPNPYGFAKDKIRVLALCPELASVREPMEIFSGLNTEWDSLITTKEDSDLYYTDGDPDSIQKKLANSSYDVYLVGFNLDRVGKELAARIQKNVENGAGLVLANAVKSGRFDAFLKKYPLSATPTVVSQGFPSVFFSFDQQGTRIGMSAVPGFQGTAKAGKGRIYSYAASYPTAFLFNEKSEKDAMFPFSAYTKAWLARLIYCASGKECLLDSPVFSGKDAVFSNLKVPAGSTAVWRLLNPAGEITSSGKRTIENGTFSITPDPVTSGNNFLVVHLEDKEGKILDYSAFTLSKTGPLITKLEDLKRYNSGSRPGEFACEASGVSSGMALEWSLEDFSGRILEQGRIPAQPVMKFTVPLNALYTNLSRVKATLKKDGKPISVSRIPVYVQDRDRLRFLSDYTPAVWPFDTNLSWDYETDCCRQLERIGFRAVGFCNRDRTHILSSGMGLAAGAAVGGGEIFCGWKQTSNVRKQQFNTAESRVKIAERAQEAAAKVRFAGGISNQVCDEPQLARPFEPDELDSHPENLAEYRVRMKAKYGSVEKFNSRCGTSYRSFDELQSGLLADARKTGRFAEFIEWRNFNTDRWCEILKLLGDNSRKQDPDALFAIPNSFGQSSLNGNDYWKILTRCGIGFSQEYTSMVYMGGRENASPIYDFDEFYRSFAPDIRVWGYIGYVNSPARLMFQPIWFAAHRYGGFTWFAAHCGLVRNGGLTTPWNLLDIPGNGFTLDAADLKKGLDSMHLMTGLGKLLLDYPWAPRETAVYYSQESLLTSFCLGKETLNGEISRDGGPLHDYYYSRHNLRYLLENLLYQYDFVAPEQVASGKLKDFKVVFMPGIVSLSDAEVASLRKFLSEGGSIIADFQPGTYDELGMKRSLPPFQGNERVHVLGSRFSSTDPAMSGRVAALLASAGVKPIMTAAGPELLAGREAFHFQKGENHIFILLRNPVSAKSGKMAQKLQFPVKGHLYNLLNGQYLGTASGAETVLDDSAPAAVFGIYPYRIDSLSADVPSSVRAGTELVARIQVKADGAKPGAHTFHVELVPPDKRKSFLLNRNLSAENGSADFRFRVAFNDPKGKWTLRVRDALSGMVSEKTFQVE